MSDKFNFITLNKVVNLDFLIVNILDSNLKILSFNVEAPVMVSMI